MVGWGAIVREVWGREEREGVQGRSEGCVRVRVSEIGSGCGMLCWVIEGTGDT